MPARRCRRGGRDEGIAGDHETLEGQVPVQAGGNKALLNPDLGNPIVTNFPKAKNYQLTQVA